MTAGPAVDGSTSETQNKHSDKRERESEKLQTEVDTRRERKERKEGAGCCCIGQMVMHVVYVFSSKSKLGKFGE